MKQTNRNPLKDLGLKYRLSRLSQSVTEAVWDGDIDDIDLDGGTDIGAAIVDADLMLIDDGAGGTNRKSAMSRVKTFVQGIKLDDFTATDDNTDLNASTSAHGLMPKGGNDTDKFYRGDVTQDYVRALMSYLQRKTALTGQTVNDSAWITVTAVAIPSAGLDIEAYCKGKDATTGNTLMLHIEGTFQNISGTVTQQGTTTYIHDAGLGDARFNINGTNVEIQVQGTANTVNWTVFFYYM